jgi:hypothetical protein
VLKIYSTIILCWTLPIIRVVFVIHDVSEVVVTVLAKYSKIIFRYQLSKFLLKFKSWPNEEGSTAKFERAVLKNCTSGTGHCLK